ncbi:MAG: DNA-3-methyladenine glycosylase [Patulibacter minatonensis]
MERDRVHPPADEPALRALLAGEVTDAAIGLLGCRLVAGGRVVEIVETEAYHEDEAACHGYRGTTPRAQKLRRPPGSSYVYLSYGIHRLINVVTGSRSVASAVLIRGVVGDDALEPSALPGPGRLANALGIELVHDGLDLLDAASPVRLLPAAPEVVEHGLVALAGPRIGITKAVELPWRYAVCGSPGVSKPRPPGWPPR